MDDDMEARLTASYETCDKSIAKLAVAEPLHASAYAGTRTGNYLQ